MRARHVVARVVVLLLLAVLVAACRGGDTVEEPTASPTPPPPNPAEPEPLSLTIEHIEMAPMGNEAIVGAPARAVNATTAEDAVRATRRALERYLNGQFVDPATRFGTDPARALLPDGVFDSLIPEQRHSLGHLALPAEGVVTGPATGTATVLFDGDEAYAVSIDYRASLRVVWWDGTEGPVVQHGSVLFTAPRWTVESFDLTVEAPQPPPPSPSPSAAEGTDSPESGA